MTKTLSVLPFLSPIVRPFSAKAGGPNIMKQAKGLDIIPDDFVNIDGLPVDMRYVHPPGRPHGAQMRIWSPHQSPVYDGVARKLGYKTRKGFQHP
ncbi:hypothetical protein niasHT_004677 [Heterodera trifolii]|uniref:Uncharacterized protein n=1 Tax=Heterodera trifolii TaxID=157864 RepID=A0ABD2M993_9BILA